MFLPNVGWNSTDYTASYPRSLYPSTNNLFCVRKKCYMVADAFKKGPGGPKNKSCVKGHGIQILNQKSKEFCLLRYNTVVWCKSTNISEGHVTSIFRVEEWAKQETSMKQAASKVIHDDYATIYHIKFQWNFISSSRYTWKKSIYGLK
jgi:hypothetical protein